MRIALTTFLCLAALTAPAAAQSTRCRVMDPTGTPLNVRSAPGGTVVATLPNGVLVSRGEQETDQNGRSWVFIRDYRTGQAIGWVFREFIACF